MLRWALAFLFIALLAGGLGFGGIEGTAGDVAKILFLAFLIMAALSFFAGRRAPPV